VSDRFQVHPSLLFTGLAITALAVAAIFSPIYWAGSLVRLAGWFVFVVASLMTLHFLWGWLRGNRLRLSSMFALGVLLQFGLAILFLRYPNLGVRLVCLILGAALLIEAIAQVIFSRHLTHSLSRVGFIVQAVLTGGLGISVFLYMGSERVEVFVIVVLGIRLLLLGLALLQISIHKANEVEQDFVFGAQKIDVVSESPGEVYAVFLGGGYHVGVYVGNGQVVDLLREINSARLVTWEEFLLGRRPEHWSYPDLPQVEADEIVRVARESVGRNMPYNFLEFNCENFAIYCKSGGKTTYSKYAQLSLCHRAVSKRPMLGMALELQTRLVGVLTHSIGGEFGKQASLRIRRASAFVTNRLLAAYLGQGLTPAVTASDQAFAEATNNDGD